MRRLSCLSAIVKEKLSFRHESSFASRDFTEPKLCFSMEFVTAISSLLLATNTAAVAEWYRYRTVACFVTGSSPVPLKTRRVGQRCTLNLSRAETSSRWCGVVVRRGGASSGVVHVT
ncbi:uncharacterized protein TNCV_4446851 [Trichonephila clavipes]|nr:uncharacterized protein TNCV_4446851 [Trichonephila clavipes]